MGSLKRYTEIMVNGHVLGQSFSDLLITSVNVIPYRLAYYSRITQEQANSTKGKRLDYRHQITGEKAVKRRTLLEKWKCFSQH